MISSLSFKVLHTFGREIHHVEEIPDTNVVVPAMVTIMSGLDIRFFIGTSRLLGALFCQSHQTDAEHDPPFDHLTVCNTFVLAKLNGLRSFDAGAKPNVVKANNLFLSYRNNVS